MCRVMCCRVVVTAALLTAGGLASRPSAVVAGDRPFRARINANAHLEDTEVPWIKINRETGHGQATHLGRFDWADVERVDFSVIPFGVFVTATFTMTAANGDKLYGEFTTIGFFDDEVTLVIHGNYEFTGGTGRFAGATGQGDIDAVALLTEGLPVTGTMTGTIDY